MASTLRFCPFDENNKINEKALEQHVKHNVKLDFTDVHVKDQTPQQKAENQGGWFEFQQYVVQECRKMGVAACPGSDAHRLKNWRQSCVL